MRKKTSFELFRHVCDSYSNFHYIRITEISRGRAFLEAETCCIFMDNEIVLPVQ